MLLQQNGTNAAALYKRRDDNIPPNWATYVAVDSADASAEKVKSLGGNIMAGPFDVMDMGRMANAVDPQGASFALWQPLKKAEFIVGETGTLCWNELMTTDAEGAQKFYMPLFGWTAKGSPEYIELHLGDRGIGGILQRLPPGVPPHWIPYFMVDDTDKFVGDLKSLGGQVYMGPTDIPNVGRFAVVADLQGAAFAVIKVQM